MNIRNERYNRNGIPLDSSFRFDFPDEAVDIGVLLGGSMDSSPTPAICRCA
jgi:hypothetical protein